MDFDHVTGRAIMKLSGSELIRGEPDASSFPNGALRDTSQARGYTTWDPTSPAFIRNNTDGATLMIPTCFVSWTGDALDVKTPLLRATSALSREATRLLKLLGDMQVESVNSTLGAEQEFFVVDRALFQARSDLVFSGRTVLGAKPPKGQELEDHYFATVPPRILAYIEEVEHECWKLGIPARTSHNEVAPGQHEMAPIFEFSNVAADHNVIQMDIMTEIAQRHGLACLLHEKPFAGVNGSGKHNNWSIATNYGLNLLEPTSSPRDNLIFQVFLAVVIRAVDLHADLLRASVAVPGNDWRLGANEAPPAIMSVYLGSEIDGLVQWILKGMPESSGTFHGSPRRSVTELNLGAGITPFRRDRTDRNRTSPFAFTGNKFEFRAVGSSQSVGQTVAVLNTIAADSARFFANELETLLEKAPDTHPTVHARTLIQSILQQHQRVIFNGNGYSKEWVELAAQRGLPNIRECVSALEQFANEKNRNLFGSLGVLSNEETIARSNIYFEHYAKVINVEAQVAESMVSTQILPAALKHQANFAASVKALKDVGVLDAAVAPQKASLEDLVAKVNSLLENHKKLQDAIATSQKAHGSPHDHAVLIRDTLKPALAELRQSADALELIVEDNIWPLPKYSDLLFLK
jgi:glutamine synthetase